MQAAFHFRRAIETLARLADAPYPPLVQVRAAAELARQLSPANPRIHEIRRMLDEAEPYEYARHKLRYLYDREDLQIVAQPEDPAIQQEEEPPAEEEDPP